LLLYVDGNVVPEYIRRSEDINEMRPDHPLRPIVIRCLNNVPEERPSATELVELLELFKTQSDDFPSQSTPPTQGLSPHVSSPLDKVLQHEAETLPQPDHVENNNSK